MPRDKDETISAGPSPAFGYAEDVGKPQRDVTLADPWAHRSSGMRCRTCMFFVPKALPHDREVTKNGALGRCRRHAPTMSGYPAVYTMDWCGDHKVDEAKL